MILHQQRPHSESGPILPRFSVDCQTLILTLTTPHGPRLHQESIQPLSIPAAVESAPLPDVDAFTITHAEAQVPEWLLMNSDQGDHPAVMHTTDPVFIALADPATALLRGPEHYRSSVDLTSEGWAYWWEDAQRAFEKLTIESTAAFGIPIPREILDQP